MCMREVCLRTFLAKESATTECTISTWNLFLAQQNKWKFILCMCHTHTSTHVHFTLTFHTRDTHVPCSTSMEYFMKQQIWYFIPKNQPSLWLQRSDPLKSSPGSHPLLVSDYVGITSSCSLLVFPLSVSLTSLRLRCLYFSVSISNL